MKLAQGQRLVLLRSQTFNTLSGSYRDEALYRNIATKELMPTFNTLSGSYRDEASAQVFVCDARYFLSIPSAGRTGMKPLTVKKQRQRNKAFNTLSGSYRDEATRCFSAPRP